MKKTEVIKTGFGIYGAIKNKRDHNRFENEIADTKRMAMFGSTSADSANMRVSNLQQYLNHLWRYINQNLTNIRRLFFFYNQLAEKNNKICEKIREQQRQIIKLNEEIKILKNLKE